MLSTKAMQQRVTRMMMMKMNNNLGFRTTNSYRSTGCQEKTLKRYLGWLRTTKSFRTSAKGENKPLQLTNSWFFWSMLVQKVLEHQTAINGAPSRLVMESQHYSGSELPRHWDHCQMNIYNGQMKKSARLLPAKVQLPALCRYRRWHSLPFSIWTTYFGCTRLFGEKIWILSEHSHCVRSQTKNPTLPCRIPW